MHFHFDHIIIAVDDLKQAIEDYKDLGFSVYYGGRHASNTTENALIIFEDGSYLELLAPTGDEPANTDAVDFRALIHTGEGFAGYALISQDIKGDIEDIRERKGWIDDPKMGKRITGDGDELQWQTATVKGKLSPFLIEDVTPRLLRVPMEVERIEHNNGVMGIAQITVIVEDLHPGIVRYKALTGVTPQVDHDSAYFLMGTQMLKIIVAQDRTMEEYLEQFGDVPFVVTLRAGRGGNEGLLPIAQAHGARLMLER